VRVHPTIDKEDPTRPNVRHDRIEPKWTRLSTDTASVDLTVDLKLTLDPTRMKHSIEVLASNLDKFLVEAADAKFM
jgi:hypothetical protein